jgi:hypothetical protein
MASNNRRELTIVLTGDAKGLTGTVKVIDAEMKKLGGSFDVVAGKARNAGKESDDAAKKIEASNKRTAAAIGIVVSAAVVGFSALVKHQLDVADATGKMAQRLGVSTEFLSSMGYAAKSTGADSQVLASSLQSLAESQLKAAGGNKQFGAAFKAMGIDFRDARGQLVPLADLLPAIAERFRTMPDGANKAALAAKLFGTEGAKLIPMLNQGKAGLAAMSEEAAALGLVLDQQATTNATALNDQLERMKSLAAGAANAFLSEMLPSVLAVSGGMGDAKEQGDHMAGMAVVLADAMKGLAVAIYAVVEITKAVASAVAAAITSMGIGLDTIGKNTDTFLTAAQKAMTQTLHMDVKGVFDTWSTAATDMSANTSKGFADMKANASQFTGDMKSLWTEWVAFKNGMFPDQAAKNAAALEADTRALHAEMDRNRAMLGASKVGIDWAGRSNQAAEEARRVNAVAAAYSKLADMQDKLGGKTDAVTKAWNDSAAAIRDIAAQGAILIKNGQDEATVQGMVSAAIDDATTARNRAIEVARRQMDVSGRMIEQIQQQSRLSTMSERDQAMAQAAWSYEQDARQQNLKLTKEQTEAEKQRVEAAAGAAFDMQRYADMQRQIAQEYVGFWENAAGSTAKLFSDGITGQIHDLKDFARQGKSILQQWVSDILAQFLRLRVLGPLLSGAMGTVAGWLGITGDLSGSALSIASQYYGGGSTVSAPAGAVGGSGGAAGAAGGANSYSGMLSNISSAKSLYSYVMGGGSYGTGAGNITSVGVDASGRATAFNPFSSPSAGSYYGGTYGFGGYSAPIASYGGALAGAYYGAHQGDGSFGTVGSTVAYGALGAGLAGTASGLAGGMSLGAAAGGAFGGAAAGTGTAVGASGAATAAASTSWIPIVGWIAALAALVDHFSGGKVFGTKYRTDASDVSLNLGPDGASADASVHQWKYRSQLSQAFGRALVGGMLLPSDWGDKDKKFKDVAVTPEMTAAAKALYDNIEKVMVTGAQKLGVDVPAMLEASLSAQSTYDKKGKLKSTDYVVDYLGRTWKEATADAAAQRIGAEALVKVVEASAGSVAQSIAEQFRASAETLMDGAQLMVAAQADIVKGNSLVALGAQATLKQVIAFAQSMQADGEKLADTYNRLVQASAAYLQFVGQFAPVSTGFGASLGAIAKQMQANIDQANALAQAAGLQHAREEDLANIHQFAAKQAADAIAQLSSAAQDLAAKLYNVTGNTLASVNAQIDKLQSKMQTAAQLAIGDNSPLNEKEKLDVALKGLRSGVTSADDVLALGRKLYASSADYAGLYAKVQEILGLPGAGQTGTAGINSALDQYNQLIGQRDQLQSQSDAMARFTDAKTLAQYVADISTTHGIGYGEAASGLGFSLTDLAKDLGVTNLTGYLDNLKLADIPGTTMDASASIVTAIQQLGRDLLQKWTGGPITSASITTSATASTSDPQILALLAKINERLASIEGSSSTTATTNQQMVKQGVIDDLRTVSGTRRDALSNL